MFLDDKSCIPLHKVLYPQLSRSALPGFVKLLFHEPGIGISILRLQGLMQTKQRPRIPKILRQVIAEDLLRSFGVTAHQQDSAERLPHWEEPILRLVVRERMLR